MGICYNLILQDDFNWGYLEDTRAGRLMEFETKFAALGYPIERLAQWYGHAVYDIDKQTPYRDDRTLLIYDYCDSCYVYNDHSSSIILLPRPPAYRSDLRKSSVLNPHNRK